MKSLFTSILGLALLTFSLGSCDTDDDHAVPQSIEVQNFVWKGLNLYYYWQEEQPLLADNRFANQTELNSFLENYQAVDLFNTLKMPAPTDRFSIIHADYTVLENALAGQTLHHGAEFGMYRLHENSNQVYGVVRYIIPNSNAAATALQRGDVFNAVNGTPLTVENYQQLLRLTNLTLNLAEWNSGNLNSTAQAIALTKTALQENPVHTAKVVQVGNKRVGYLLYNGFWTAYDEQLNQAMAYFQGQNVTDFVLDLRYNSGGTLTSAQYLASMLTGGFNGQVLGVLDWNSKANAYWDQQDSQSRYSYFVNTTRENMSLNHLNLNKVYVLTSATTASASELVINGLKPYIDVVQIGTATAGKNVGSITMYDSPTYRKQGVNPRHRYAMQPIVFKIANAQGFSDYTNGLAPTYTLPENTQDMGELGESSELLFARALALIQGSDFRMKPATQQTVEIDNSQALRAVGGLYIN